MRRVAQRDRPFGQRETKRCFNCGEQEHLAAQCPNRRAAQEVNVAEGFEAAIVPHMASQEQELRYDRVQNGIQPETSEQIFHDEGSDGEESVHRNESVSVFSIAKTTTPFVTNKIHIRFQFMDKHKKSSAGEGIGGHRQLRKYDLFLSASEAGICHS